MILLLGGSGYIGSAFVAEMERRGIAFQSLSREACDFTCFSAVLGHLKRLQPDFVINAAGFTGKPNVDACEVLRAETLLGNVVLPQVVSDACSAAGLPWAHVSSGCVYSGAKIHCEGSVRIEKDLIKPELRQWLEHHPEAIFGYDEMDASNFSFDNLPCSFYSGTKALAEQVVAKNELASVWRLRMPFDEVDCPQNYLSKLLRYERTYDNINSLSHRGDFVRACLDLWEKHAAPGIYNVTNPGFVSTRQVVDIICRTLSPGRCFTFWESDEEFYRHAALAPRSNCVLDTAKLLSAGVSIRPVEEALEHALLNWRRAS